MTPSSFGPATRAWFEHAFPDGPTPAQEGAWASVAGGRDTLVVAPTGSGKTLAAFLWSLDRLLSSPAPQDPARRCRVLYVSPLKALAADVERNLRAPLAGITAAARELGAPVSPVTVGVRTGDTPADERRRMATRPPDILITTPESLFLVLTSRAREGLAGVETVIVDEVHALAGTKRGSHLALSLERLEELVERRTRRIGLSATVRPAEAVAEFLGGADIVAPPDTPHLDLGVAVPVFDMEEPDLPAPPPLPGPEDAQETGARVAAPDSPRPPARPSAGAPAGPPTGGGSLWPHLERRVLDLVEEHRSTIVFTNGRRTAERLCARVNDLYAERHGADPPPEEVPALVIAQSGSSRGAAPVIARAHHGSMSKAERAVVEEDLKAGRLRCVVATSSLELGVDMGAVDLVVQVAAPPSVASGLQRVGRAGHRVGGTSRGVFLPAFRGDLLTTAVVVERMRAGEIEPLRVPRSPLDVLAQQIVAMVAMDEWPVAELAAVVRRAAPFSGLGDAVLESVLDMLSGRYPSDEFAELRPRLVWDRRAGVLRARPDSQRLAVVAGGTIPDRGMYTVHLAGAAEDAAGGAAPEASAEGGGGRRRAPTRVGELDEEMVYESRVGDVFVLGSSSWRIDAITADRVLVTPAPGRPGRMPFWKADAQGRPVELGRAVGAAIRRLGEAPEEAAAGFAGLDPWAARNLAAYVAEQREAVGQVPDDRTVVVERFRDQVGERRVVVHSPLGDRVHAPWALALAARIRERFGVESRVLHGDDGIVLNLPETAGALDEPGVLAGLVAVDPETVEAVVTDELTGTALFASRFRECAARALLLPRQRPDRRMPLWQQRLRASHLLSVAGRYGSFPIVLEAARECLQDLFDVPALVEVLRGVRSREVRVVEVETDRASPFARSLLMEYTAAFLYEGDVPAAEARAGALSMDPSLLSDLLGRTDLRDLLDPGVVGEVDALLQRTAAPVRDEEGAADLLREVGPLTGWEAAARGVRPEWLHALEEAGRAVRMALPGTVEPPGDGSPAPGAAAGPVERWCAVEDVARLRDALGARPPSGVPEVLLEPVGDPLRDLVSRYARTHGPFTAAGAAARLGLGEDAVTGVLRALAREGRVSRGGFRPGGSGTEWCDAEVLRRLRRGSIARLRAEVEPVEPVALARFSPLWQRAVPGERRRGPDAVFEAVESLRGAPVPASALESLVLPARVEGYEPRMLDELTQAGEVVWAGAGPLPGGDGRVVLLPADEARELAPDPVPPAPGTVEHAVLEALRGGGALFFRDIADRVTRDGGAGAPADADLVAALWALVWDGVVANDTLAPVRALLGTGGAARPRPPRPGRARRAVLPTRSGPPTAAGRWWVLPEREPDPTRRVLASVQARLERQGVLVKGWQGGGISPEEYRVLRSMEEAGRVRRGYFVAGLGGAQFALPGAVDRLRSLAGGSRDGAVAPVVLAADDPANPFGRDLPWPEGEAGGRPARAAGAVVVVDDGRPTLYAGRGGRSALTLGASPHELSRAAAALAGAVRAGALDAVTVERADGAEVFGTPLDAALVSAGFHVTPRGLRLRP
ncbi:ATP-dependent helicase Lhr and Lhr-like helicase [Nocardiopsis flavescens]|uniref:ATP-dependent helicase Lhr and Lhr-like helicase n=1 Tax=Nocardiopsis flavescens TaxID=758803 RepID=A0A1M6E8X9_9ACTN|nr:DEAD/DEAH box helicase [Nocardiopsis flavescens]SHI81873.1 ATP-dependent helicase Lhr and Lhr-like helicase [Nocardiopsis flavescens]